MAEKNPVLDGFVRERELAAFPGKSERAIQRWRLMLVRVIPKRF